MTKWIEQAREGCEGECDPTTGLCHIGGQAYAEKNWGKVWCYYRDEHQRTATKIQEAVEPLQHKIEEMEVGVVAERGKTRLRERS